MKLRTLTASIAAATIAVAGMNAPQDLAAEPGSEPVTAEELEQGQEEISFESSKGAYVLPQETITLTADSVADGVEIRNAYIETAPGETSAKWTVQRGVNDEGLPTLTITAPDAPENQGGQVQEYGEYTVHIRTSNWNSYLFPINFAPERPAETPADLSSRVVEQSSRIDFRGLVGSSL